MMTILFYLKHQLVIIAQQFQKKFFNIVTSDHLTVIKMFFIRDHPAMFSQELYKNRFQGLFCWPQQFNKVWQMDKTSTVSLQWCSNRDKGLHSNTLLLTTKLISTTQTRRWKQKLSMDQKSFCHVCLSFLMSFSCHHNFPVVYRKNFCANL